MSEIPTIKMNAGSDTTTEKGSSLMTSLKKRRESMMSQNSSTGHPPPLLRRRSTLKSLTQSIHGLLGLRRMTLTKKSDVSEKPLVRMENTYKVEPDREITFSARRVSDAALEILEAELNNKQYNHSECSQQACDLSIKIKSKVKEMDFKRYKIVCNVILGDVANQGFEVASRCVWDSKTDNFACVPYKNNSIFAVAMIHGCYYE